MYSQQATYSYLHASYDGIFRRAGGAGKGIRWNSRTLQSKSPWSTDERCHGLRIPMDFSPPRIPEGFCQNPDEEKGGIGRASNSPRSIIRKSKNPDENTQSTVNFVKFLFRIKKDH
jgi:glycosidase